MKCDDKISFEDCELQILRSSIDKIDKVQKENLVKNPDIQIIISIVEKFIEEEGLICYGGTAINNILPEEDQFYNKDTELPDYDFFSHDALNHAKKLADIYYKAGFREVEAKSGIHHGTYKVFVNFIPIADITYMPLGLFNSINKESIKKNGIKYCPPNYLRMSMYMELSRPKGDISRWEKVLKRLTLLNKHYPINDEYSCLREKREKKENQINDDIVELIKINASNEGLVFFGGLAYKKYRKSNRIVLPYHLISFEPLKSARIIQEDIESKYNKINIELKTHNSVGEIVPKHIEVIINNITYAIIYEPIGCHNYNIINEKTKKGKTINIKVATIDTILSFYLAFIYVKRPYYNIEKLICTSEYLFDIQRKNIKNHRGLHNRFTIECYGFQDTIESMRLKKTEMYKKLRKGTEEFNEWFLRYIPEQEAYKKRTRKNIKTTKSKKKNIKRKTKNKTRKRK